ncbi:hypothetical protein F5X71_21165 [Nocardia brasiliensis]|uniref:DUF8176 domain-containing protein n=1 Tax=Nocardia brasiliensis TaxID=37326 RepID=A0A6G9XUC6_NOCBR|nr:hypothetical protein [Nocardia brasiliensis]QIS04507.1 hypothetical protein F5X71_21165 [Nocardia brasiliensis]
MPLWPGMIPPPRPQRWHADRARRPWLVATVALAGSMATVAVVLAYSAQAGAPRQSATYADPVLGGGPGCQPTRNDQLVRGNGSGSTASGPDVILAFQYAYYVARSGADARAVTAPDAAVPPVEVISAGIRSVPAGTQHCVMITPMADGRFDVVITEVRPDAAVRTYRQFVTVTTGAGAVSIAKIAPPT